jgi:hypothetical protein
MVDSTRNDRVTLERLIDTKLAAVERLLCFKVEALERSVTARLDALDRATQLATSTMDKRLEGMNEFRAQLKDQAGTFLSRQELEAFKALVETDMRVLRQANAEAKGKASQQSVLVSNIIAIAGLVLALLSLGLRLF